SDRIPRSGRGGGVAPEPSGGDWDKNRCQDWDRFFPDLDISVRDPPDVPISTSRCSPARFSLPWQRTAEFGAIRNSPPPRRGNSGGRNAVWSLVSSCHTIRRAISLLSWSARTVTSSGRSLRHQSGIKWRLIGIAAPQMLESG